MERGDLQHPLSKGCNAKAFDSPLSQDLEAHYHAVAPQICKCSGIACKGIARVSHRSKPACNCFMQPCLTQDILSVAICEWHCSLDILMRPLPKLCAHQLHIAQLCDGARDGSQAEELGSGDVEAVDQELLSPAQQHIDGI